MGNDVATRSRTELAQASALDPFAHAGTELAGSSALYMKFNGNSGEMSYGANATEVEADEKMAANVAGARRGWICWKDSEVVEEIMVPIAQGQPPLEHTLTDHGPYDKHEDGTEDGWSAQFAIDFRLLGEAHDGAETVYKTSTKSAMRPLGDLVKQFAREYKNHPGAVPIVEFGKGSYMPKDKKRGKKYFPTFKIVEWMDEAELLATYGEGNSVEEGDENDNLIAETNAIAEAANAKKLAASKKADKAAAKANAKASAPADEDEDEKALRLVQEKIAAKKAAAKAAEEEAARIAAEAAAAAEAPPEDEDEDEKALREAQERIAAKKAAASAATSTAVEPTGDKPAPAGARQNRRRNF